MNLLRNDTTTTLPTFLGGARWLSAILLLALVLGCDGGIGVRGRVVDADGAPITGADLSLDRPEDAAGFDGETDAEGCFTLGGLVAPGERDYFLKVSSAGYEPSEGTVRSTGEYAVLVQLAAAGSGEESSFTVLPDGDQNELESCNWNTYGTQVEVDEPVATPAQPLPAFEDFPVTESFTGQPAEVDLDSHPEAKDFRTALTEGAEAGAAGERFAGHYRIVVIGCGASCKAVWAVDLEDGSVDQIFTASVSVSFRPDSRLIIENDPAYYEGLLDKLSAAEVEAQMATYGPPRFWIEKDGKFETISHQQFRVDPASRKVVATSEVDVTNRWQCANDVEIACADGACDVKSGAGFTPMSVSVAESGVMSVCAYSGCWEGTAEVTENQQFLVLIGHALEFSTSPGPAAAEDIVVVLDRTDEVATLKAGDFAHPLLCKRR